MYTVIETPKFEQASKKIWNEKERSEFFAYLSQNPFVGDVVQQGKGVRKVRWSYQGQGKRGGVRVLYFNVLQSGFILMVDIYTKNEKENISDAELKKITELK
ncbi:MAG: type II toxin-antitoxin system RelE/ParE family toxin [[Pasteurella] mairii]|uniref:Uncharacterized protein conserved in bacteria n=1 Tax=[Pasteurella] mairii TaxID=757 RepID=A0A379B3Z4_9PAST|nr:type II toxin-antitoxin system RelE/ParE family toxin [[Pasteurella] mairii]SUB33345.1 Uncharacterized protein conserved in bacteria [[Pasteurella] mairii]